MTGIAVVGAAETTELGKIPNTSQLMLHADAALNAMADAGINIKHVDGIATAGMRPTDLAFYLGMTPNWVDGTAVVDDIAGQLCLARGRKRRDLAVAARWAKWSWWKIHVAAAVAALQA
mgnify:CR=1 FL=1